MTIFCQAIKAWIWVYSGRRAVIHVYERKKTEQLQIVVKQHSCMHCWKEFVSIIFRFPFVVGFAYCPLGMCICFDASLDFCSLLCCHWRSWLAYVYSNATFSGVPSFDHYIHVIWKQEIRVARRCIDSSRQRMEAHCNWLFKTHSRLLIVTHGKLWTSFASELKHRVVFSDEWS